MRQTLQSSKRFLNHFQRYQSLEISISQSARVAFCLVGPCMNIIVEYFIITLDPMVR